MKEEFNLSRRGFIKVSSAAGVGLLISIYLPGCTNEQKPTPLIPTVTNAPLHTGYSRHDSAECVRQNRRG